MLGLVEVGRQFDCALKPIDRLAIIPLRGFLQCLFVFVDGLPGNLGSKLLQINDGGTAFSGGGYGVFTFEKNSRNPIKTVQAENAADPFAIGFEALQIHHDIDRLIGSESVLPERKLSVGISVCEADGLTAVGFESN